VGRPPKPTKIKILEGNRRKVAKAQLYNSKEPKFEGVPSCPKHLTKDAKAEWRRLAPQLAQIGILTKADRGAFVAYCEAWALLKKCSKTIQQNGLTYDTVDKNGNRIVKMYPEVSIAFKAQDSMRRFCVEFGLTPSSRGRMAAPGKEEEPDPLEKLLGRG
jgi:P27 family predicted phage terminase small subunit